MKFSIGQHEYTDAQLREWDQAHSWHPFTPMSEYLETEPLIIARGEGVRLQDTQGKWYLDGCSSVWLNLHGHCHPALNQAIQTQLETLAHSTTLGQANVPATVLAKRLTEIAPHGLSRVQFSDCGASAVEIAIKIAIQYWANQGHPTKRQILGFQNNYHGDTLGAMAVAASELFHKPFLDLLPYNPRLEYPACIGTPYVEPGETGNAQDCAAVVAYLKQHHENIAAIIIEPVEGAGGMIPAKPGYLHQLKKCCGAFDVLLIVDEVATGFGHTGHLFACDAENVTPDILCLGKALTAGYLPVAATLTTEAVFKEFLGPVEERKTLYHGHSFAGNQLGCVAALASLDLLAEITPSLKEKTLLLSECLSSLAAEPIVAEVRQRGLMIGLPLTDPEDTVDPRDGWALRRLAYEVMLAARDEGLIIRPIGNVVILLPPPCSTAEDLQEMVAALGRAIRTVQEKVQ